MTVTELPSADSFRNAIRRPSKVSETIRSSPSPMRRGGSAWPPVSSQTWSSVASSLPSARYSTIVNATANPSGLNATAPYDGRPGNEHSGSRLALTPEEAREIAEAQAKRTAERAAASSAERAAPQKGGNVGAYNDFWFEWGGENYLLDGKFRTSILTDPPDGRMPTLHCRCARAAR